MSRFTTLRLAALAICVGIAVASPIEAQAPVDPTAAPKPNETVYDQNSNLPVGTVTDTSPGGDPKQVTVKLQTTGAAGASITLPKDVFFRDAKAKLSLGASSDQLSDFATK